MKTLQIFDPAMCCSTGVCGPSVDPNLLRLSADVAFLKSKGVSVDRFNLAHQPDAFTARPIILHEMGSEAEHLPIFLIDGEIVAKARYPSRKEMASWFDIDAATSSEKPRVEFQAVSSSRNNCCPGGDC